MLSSVEENMMIEQIINRHGLIKVIADFNLKNHSYEDDDVVVLSYNQLKTPKQNETADQCRGVVLNKNMNGEWEVVCRPFDRFYNVGESPFDFGDGVLVYEKADGSMIKIYWFKTRWEIGTRRSAFGENGVYTDKKRSYRNLVINSFGLETEEEFQDMMKDQNKELTYLLECIGPENQVKTIYLQAEMVFIAARNTKTGEYVNVTSFPLARHTKVFAEYASEEQCRELLKTLREDEEGFVLVNKLGCRAKLKNPKYLDFGKKQKKKSTNSRTTLVNAVVEGEFSEYDAVFQTDKCTRLYKCVVVRALEKYETYEKFLTISKKHKTGFVWRILNETSDSA